MTTATRIRQELETRMDRIAAADYAAELYRCELEALRLALRCNRAGWALDYAANGQLSGRR